MASPFSIFRKHQKTFMVVLVIGSMIAFTGESLFTAAGENAPVLFGLLGCGIALVAGFQFGRPIPYAIGGAIVGALLGAFLPAFAGGGVSTELGSFTDKRLQQLQVNRTIANSFVANCQSLAFDTNQVSNGAFNLVSRDAGDLILGEAMRAEADEMGIYVDDAAVNQFIKEYTGGKLTEDDFIKAQASLQASDGTGVSESELYDILRGEIQAVLARNMLMPRRTGQGGTPEMYWDMYQRLNVNQEMVFTALNVDSFIDQVEEPSESELKAFYEEHKNKAPGTEPGSPGFFQGRQVKLAYLEIDYTTVADSIPEVTEEDVKKQYEDNKDLLYKEALPADPTEEAGDDDSEFNLDDLTPKKDADKPTDPAKPEAPAGEEAEKPEGETPPEPAKPETPEKKPEGDGGCDDFFQDEEPQSSEEASTTEPATTEAGQEPKKTPALTIPDPSTPDTPADQEQMEPPTAYRPLDEKLKKQIRQTLKAERAGNALAKLVEECQEEMDRLQQQRVNRDLDKQLGEETVEALSDSQLLQALKAFADKKDGVFYVETPVIGVNDFVDREEYPIAYALPPGGQFTRAQNVLMRLFGTQGAVAQFATEVVEEAFGNPGNRYVYWVVGEIPPHTPKDFEEVKDKVLKTWKQMKARPLAEARGKALAEKVKAGLADEKTMSELLKDETETGKDDSPALVVTESSVFRWMESSSAASFSMMQQPPQLGQVPGVRGMSDDFMDYVFRGLKPNDVGVTNSVDLSTYYVVQPVNRFPVEDAEVDATKARFLRERHFEQFTSPIPRMLDQQIGDTNLNWVRQIQKKYGLDAEA